MRKLLVLALITGLMVVPNATVNAKRPKAKTMKYFLHFPANGSECGTRYMDLKDRQDSTCGYTFQPANEVLHQTGQPLIGEWPAKGGFPFKLDATKPIKANFQLVGYGGPARGQAIFELAVTATVGGQPVTLVEDTIELTMTTAGTDVAQFKAKPPKRLNGKKVTSLQASTNVHGVNNFHHFNLEGPDAAAISVPARG